VQGPPGAPGAPGAAGGQVEKYYHQKATGEVSHGSCHWAYEGAEGPEMWGSICEGKYATCSAGKSQSPIDVQTGSLTVASAAQTLGWNIPDRTAAEFVKYSKGQGGESSYELYNGHTFQVEHVAATFTYGNVVYKLKQFQLHTVSEHTIDGEHSALEIQFVHTTDDTEAANKVLVVAAFFQVAPGQGSPSFIRQLVKAIPSLTDVPSAVVNVDFAEVAQTVMIGSLDHRGGTEEKFTPNFKNYMTYQGSYTAPPCTEGVQWILLRNPVYIYGDDSKALHALLGDNYRPVQPLNGRVVSSTV